MERKGIRPFVKAASLLPGYKFIQAGCWIDNSIETLKANASANVEFLGYISDQQLMKLYERSIIYLQPSLHEGFGMSVAEAMMAGCIPVVTGFGALPEVTGKYAVKIKTLNAEGIMEALESVVDYPYSPLEIQEHIRQTFTIAKRKELLNQCLNTLLEKPHDVS